MLTQDLRILIHNVTDMYKRNSDCLLMDIVREQEKLVEELGSNPLLPSVKWHRDNVLWQACSVLTNISVLLCAMNATEEEIYKCMTSHCRRALLWYENSGEV